MSTKITVNVRVKGISSARDEATVKIGTGSMVVPIQAGEKARLLEAFSKNVDDTFAAVELDVSSASLRGVL